MPSLSLHAWRHDRSALLDDIESAHRAVRGAGARTAAQQVNQAYVVLLSAQFQAFCRDLHSECAEYFVMPVADPTLREMLLANLLYGRKIDRGNPNPGNIGADFNRFDILFWPAVVAHRARNALYQTTLDELNDWRNAIAHQDFATTMLAGGHPRLTLAQVQNWRKACDGLSRSFDEVLRTNIQTMTGVSPW